MSEPLPLASTCSVHSFLHIIIRIFTKMYLPTNLELCYPFKISENLVLLITNRIYQYEIEVSRCGENRNCGLLDYVFVQSFKLLSVFQSYLLCPSSCHLEQATWCHSPEDCTLKWSSVTRTIDKKQSKMKTCLTLRIFHFLRVGTFWLSAAIVHQKTVFPQSSLSKRVLRKGYKRKF
jgi:hypothetical protein